MKPWDGHDLNFYVKIMSGTWRLIMDASHVSHVQIGRLNLDMPSCMYKNRLVMVSI